MSDEAPWEDYGKGNDEAPWEDYGEPEKPSGGVGDFVNSMALGSSIGENLPLVGKPIAKLGTMIGSGLQAATEAPFSDATISDLYKRNMALSQQAEAEQAAYDERSPSAQAVKTGLAGLAVGPLKRPMPMGGEAGVENIAAKTGIGEFQYPGNAAADKAALMKEYLAKEMAAKASKPSLIQKAWPMIKEQGLEMLPYPARAALKMYKRINP